MNKQYRPNIIRGGIALPLGNNYYLMRGRKHKYGGIDVGKDLEVEDGEVMKVSPNDVKVFSAVPFLNGKSPVEKLMGGENPNKVFAQQEKFKKVNKIKDDGTKAQLGKGKKITTTTIPESEQYAVTTPDGQRKVFNNKEEAQTYISANTPKGYSLYDTTNYGSNIDKGQTAILDRNTEREIEKATKQERLAAAKLANRQQNQEISKEILLNMPGISDANDLYQIAKDAYNKKYLNAGIGLGLLALPNVIEKPLKYVGRNIKKLFTKTPKKLNTNTINNVDNINIDNKSYQELAEDYTDSFFDNEIKSSNDINNENLQSVTNEQWDELYNKAIKNNNLKEAQKLRDLHFDQKAVDNKNNKTQFHGVSYVYNPDFTIFNPKGNHKSIFTSDNIDLSSSYVTEFTSDDELKKFAEKDKIYKKKYLKSKESDIKSELELVGEVDKNDKVGLQSLSKSKQDLENIQYELQTLENDPVKYYKRLYGVYPERIKQLKSYLKNPLIIDAKSSYWNDIPINQLSKDIQNKIKIDPRSGKYSTLSLEDVSRELGYDGVIIDNVLDYGGHSINKYIDLNKSAQVVINNNPNNLKLSDAITYDDNGNIIPLSKRDDFNNPDIRYSWLLPTIGVGTGLSLINNNENNQYKYGGKMNKKQLGGKANIYRVDSNGKTSWGMNYSTGKDSKARKKALLGKSRKNVVTDEYYFPTEQDVLGVGNYDGTNDYMDVNRKIHSPIKKYSNSLKSRYFDIYNEDREGFYNFNINKTKSENINTQKNKIDVLGVGNKTKSELKRNNSTGNISKVNTNSHDYIPKYIDSKITFNYTPKTIKAPKNVIPTIKQYSSKDISDKHNNFNTNGKSILNDFTTSNYIGLGTNVVGSIISNLINRNTLNKMKYSNQPIPKVARKLKTNYNINPQLDTIREQLNKSLTDVDQNTTSSSTALNRKNRLRLANIMNTNQLFGTKENVETELINKDRLNQQNIANSNVDDYNKWVAGKTTFKNTILEKQGENNVGLVQNIAQGVSNTLSNIEKRKATQNNIIAILAANPNVNPEYLRSLGADWVTDKMIANWKRANNK